MKLAVFTPLPPARSGVAAYNAFMLPYLTALGELDIWVDGKACAITTGFPLHIHDLRRENVEEALNRYDALIYHLGNDPTFHGSIYELAVRYPGVVVLHDWALHHMVAGYLGIGERYRQELIYELGSRGDEIYQAVKNEGFQPWESTPLSSPMNRRILDRSLGIIVHSRYARELARTRTCKPIGVVPLAIEIRQLDGRQSEVRQRLKLPLDRVIVGVFGFINPNKRVHQVLKALADPRLQHPIDLVIVGEWSGEDPREVLEGFPFPEKVRIVGYASEKDFDSYLCAVDAVVNLRYPTMGESSEILTRALSFGKAVAVTSVGSYAEYPDDVIFKVRPEHELDDLLLFLSQINLGLGAPIPAVSGFLTNYPSPSDIASEFLRFVQGVIGKRVDDLFWTRQAVTYHELGLRSTDEHVLNALSSQISFLP